MIFPAVDKMTNFLTSSICLALALLSVSSVASGQTTVTLTGNFEHTNPTTFVDELMLGGQQFVFTAAFDDSSTASTTSPFGGSIFFDVESVTLSFLGDDFSNTVNEPVFLPFSGDFASLNEAVNVVTQLQFADTDLQLNGLALERVLGFATGSAFSETAFGAAVTDPSDTFFSIGNPGQGAEYTVNNYLVSVGTVVTLDCNGDGVVSILDANCTANDSLDMLLEDNGTARGDSDGVDGVAFADFLTLSTNFGLTPAIYTDGDFDKDGAVGFPDFLTLSVNFGQGGDFSANVAAVPEPSAAALLLVAMGFFFAKPIRKG